VRAFPAEGQDRGIAQAVKQDPLPVQACRVQGKRAADRRQGLVFGLGQVEGEGTGGIAYRGSRSATRQQVSPNGDPAGKRHRFKEFPPADFSRRRFLFVMIHYVLLFLIG
jgi:hypothetical protein